MTRLRRSRRILVGGLAALLVVMALPFTAAAAVITGLVTVAQAAAGSGWAVHPDQTSGGSEAFVEGPLTPPSGRGSLEMGVSGTSDKAVVFTVPKPAIGGVVPPGDIAAAIATPWASTTGSFSTFTANTSNPAASIPVFRLVGFQVFNATNPLLSTGFTSLNFEGSNQGTVVANQWQTWKLGPTSLVWQSNQTDAFCPITAPCTMAAFAAQYPNGAWGQVQAGMGSGVPAGSTGYVDDVNVSDGTTTFTSDFEVPSPSTSPPAAVDDHYATPQDQQLLVYAASGVLLNDLAPAGHVLDASLGTTTTHGSLSLQSDGSFIYTPSAGFNGVDTFTYTVRDQTTLIQSGPATVTITVTAGPPPTSLGGSRFTPLNPARIVDTRTGLGGSGPTTAGATMTFAAAGQGGVPPSGATGVVLNVTVTNPTEPGFVQVFPAGTSAPGASSTVNVDHPGQTISDLVIVGLDAAGRFSIHTQSPAHLVVDVFGYFVPAAASDAGRLVTVSPLRVLDTRSGTGVAAPGPLPPDGSLALNVSKAVPAGAQAVVMTLTADQAVAPGYIQAIPTGGTTPLRSSSNLNIDRAGETMANTVIVPIGADGTVTLFSQSGAHLVADVVGYFTGAGGPAATSGLVVPVTPVRLADSRVRQDPLPDGATLTVPLAGRGPLLPLPPSAIAGTVTATNTTASGYVQVIPTGAGTPIGSTSSLNINGADRIVAGATILSTGSGSLTVHLQSATHIVYDVTGYFT